MDWWWAMLQVWQESCWRGLPLAYKCLFQRTLDGQSKDRGQKTKGLVYALTQQDAQSSNVVVTSTISVSDIYAYVLFDSGTTHSFISITFVRKHDMLCEPMRTELCWNINRRYDE